MNSKNKKIKVELNDWEITRVLEIINALKSFNRTTDEKCPIDYELVVKLDGADHYLAKFLGLKQPETEKGYPNIYADYEWEK